MLALTLLRHGHNDGLERALLTKSHLINFLPWLASNSICFDITFFNCPSICHDRQHVSSFSLQMEGFSFRAHVDVVSFSLLHRRMTRGN